MFNTWDDFLDGQRIKYYYMDKRDEYRQEAIQKVCKDFPLDKVESVLEFIAWGWEENEKGAEYFVKKYKLDDLHLYAFRTPEIFEEYVRELEAQQKYDY